MLQMQCEPGLEQLQRRNTAEEPQLPLWLTEGELEAIICLCAASAGSGGSLEPLIFRKLSDTMRAFWR